MRDQDDCPILHRFMVRRKTCNGRLGDSQGPSNPSSICRVYVRVRDDHAFCSPDLREVPLVQNLNISSGSLAILISRGGTLLQVRFQAERH
jgi:hypothetical protein